nr:N-formylglutamate amidohydrolase [Rubrimonas cliftonensis]
MDDAPAQHRLLAPGDPAPVEVVNAASAAPVLLLCEHAGRAVPAALAGLGVSGAVLSSHRGWDIGAEAVARGVAAKLGAPLVIQRYSRLVIDANRPPGSAQSILETSDGEAVPGNRGLSEAARRARVAEIFEPMDRAIVAAFERAPRRAAFSIHSFTPTLGGAARPWRAGFLSRRDVATAQALMAAVRAALPGLTLALNEPYRIEDETDWFIPAHAEPRGLAHALIEIRNDQIDDAAGAALWVDLLADAISAVLRIDR